MLKQPKTLIALLVGIASLVGAAFAAESHIYTIVDRQTESAIAPILVELKYIGKATEQQTRVLLEILKKAHEHDPR